MSCNVYGATPMTGVDKKEQRRRALFLKSVFSQYGLNLISPVLEEGVEDKSGPLIQTSESQLEDFWKRDKEIMVWRARVTVIDGADEGSVGICREYCLNRGVLWKPTVIIWKSDRGITVAKFEDDAIFVRGQEHEVAQMIKEKWGTWPRYAKWRAKMILKTLPNFLLRQLLAWR